MLFLAGPFQEVDADVRDEITESCSALQPLRIPLMVRPQHCTSVVDVR